MNTTKSLISVAALGLLIGSGIACLRTEERPLSKRPATQDQVQPLANAETDQKAAATRGFEDQLVQIEQRLQEAGRRIDALPANDAKNVRGELEALRSRTSGARDALNDFLRVDREHLEQNKAALQDACDRISRDLQLLMQKLET
jgi:hypothetical protein